MDTQIFYALFIPLLFLFLKKKSVYHDYGVAFLIIPISLFFLIISSLDFNAFREAFSFISFFLVYFLIVQSIRYGYLKVIYNWSCVASLVYFFVAILQVVFDKYIFDFLVQVRTSDGRGVTSLSTEPTFYGITCIFLTFLILVSTNYRPNLLGKISIALNLISIVFLAKSALAIVFIGIAAAFLLVVFALVDRKRFLYICLSLLIFLFLFVNVFVDVLDGSRFILLLGSFMDSGVVYLLNNDASLNMRVAGFFLPIYLAIDNLFMPFGFGFYPVSLMQLSSEFSGIFRSIVFDNDRVMSFVGSYIYYLGWLGFVFMIFIFYKAFFSHSLNKIIIAEFAFLVLLLINAVPVAMPIVAIVFAVLSERKCLNE